MIVNIEDPKLDQELQALSSDLGQSVNEIVIVAVQEAEPYSVCKSLED